MILRAFFVLFFSLTLLVPNNVTALEIIDIPTGPVDSDSDGLSDNEERDIFRTDPIHPDTDNDGYLDGNEVKYKFDPNVRAPDDKLEKKIEVTLSSQELKYFLGNYELGGFKISSGVRRTPTPKGSYSIQKKLPSHLYKGVGYVYPNTRWNMLFKYQSGGNLYIHGAYWHNKFGTPMSHGCINVSYADIEPLYNWADLGTKVIIQ